jgi:hypothetical protein
MLQPGRVLAEAQVQALSPEHQRKGIAGHLGVWEIEIGEAAR